MMIKRVVCSIFISATFNALAITSIIGHIDPPVGNYKSLLISGWACQTADPTSISVHLYAGGAAGTGVAVKSTAANLSSEAAVSSMCTTNYAAHRFSFSLSQKGQVEKAVQDGRYALWHKAPGFNSLEALNDWLEQECQAVWQQQQHPEFKPHTLWQCLQEERLHLMHISSGFDGFIEHSKQVSSTCLITFENNKYSVPASFANRRVSLRVYPAVLHIIAEGRKVTEHLRVFTRDHNAPGQVLYNWRHYLLVAQRKPGSLRNGAPFQTLPESFKQLQQVLLRKIGGDRQMVDVLALVLHHEAELVEQAITEALQSGCASKDHVINCLHRLIETPPPEPVPVAAHLQLSIEPISDTSRYEQLGGGYAH